MSAWNPFDHDVGVTYGSTTIGLMLDKDKNGKPRYQEFDDPILAAQYFTGTPDATYRPPDREIVIQQDDFSAGFGLKYYDRNQSKRYYSSINCDGRFGTLIPGPLAATVTKPTAPTYYALTLTDGGLEVWTDASNLTNYTKALTGTGALVREAVTIHGGTYSAKFDLPGVADTVKIYPNITWHNEYRNHYVTFTAWCYFNTAEDVFRIGIYDGVTWTYSSYHTGNSTWQQLSVTKQLAATATELQLACFGNNAGVGSRAGYYDDLAFTTTYSEAVVGVTTCGTEFNDNVYAAFGNILAKLNTGTGVYDYVYHFPATITDMCVSVAGTYLVIALGNTEYIWNMTVAEGFGRHDSRAFYFVASSPSTTYGIRQAGGQPLFTCTNPAGAWTQRQAIGYGYDNQTDLMVDESNNVIVGKENIPYYVDITTWAGSPLMATLQVLKSATSCKNTFAWKNKIYVQAGTNSLFEFSGTPGSATAEITNISPSHFMQDLSDYDGAIQAITGDDEYLYIVVDNATKIEVLAGRWEVIDGVNDWRWHPISEITLTGCETAFITSVYRKRMYIASTLAADSLYYIPITTQYGNITADTDYAYQTGGTLITPWHHLELKGDNKAFYTLKCTLGHAYSANIYFTVSYQKWGDDLAGGVGWTSIGNFDGTAADRTETRFIPADSSAVSPVSNFIRFRFVPVTNSTTTPAILESYDCRGAWRPTKRWLIACAIRCDDEVLTRRGRLDKGTAADVKSAIEAGAALSWPITFYDFFGATQTVNFLQPVRFIPDNIEYFHDQRILRKGVYELLLQRVSLS